MKRKAEDKKAGRKCCHEKNKK